MSENAVHADTRFARRIPDESGVFVVLVVVALALGFISPSFRTVSNSFVLLVNGAVIMFLALGQSFVLLTGGIDLSTGANIAMTGVIAALLMKLGLPWPIASLIALSAATLLGLINGALTHFLRIPAFIATFSTQGVALAIPLIITGAQSISVHDFGFSWIGQGRVLGVPMPVILVAVAAIVAGVSLFGGVGTIQGAMIGAVLIAVVSNGMNVINVQSYWQSLVIGVIILLGVTFDTYRRSRRGKPTLRKAAEAATGAAASGPARSAAATPASRG